ncbi:hypothetical protein [Aurantimonas sp. VKM B-3413]|uniref:hypothetical protein n=1 Tax=Aurantimonas sp. VKM B-3413 TaxID=2779401 RepID=UPI001E3E1EC1|nr:hypothetical protein [Aurantimonas sp. VKM B-3413]MCB8838421.1 hypothetical protein [Aurantimonas sp. VKM B-3413]
MAFSGLHSAAAADGPDAAKEIRQALDRTLIDVFTSGCIGADQNSPYSVSFYGLPLADPHFSGNDRSRLNSLVLSAINGTEAKLNVSPVENAGALAPISSGGEADREALARALSQLGTSTLPMVLKATRPTPETARLELVVFARDGSGAYRCSRSVTQSVGLADLGPADSAVSSTDFVTLDGAYRLALGDMAPLFADLDTLRLETSVPQTCAFFDRAADRFQDAYYRSGTLDFGAGRTVGRLPALAAPQADDRSKAGGETDALLSLRFTVPSDTPGALDLLVTFLKDKRLHYRRSYQVATDGASLETCTAPPACVERGEIVDFSVGPALTRTGDKLSVRASVRQCQPVFFAVAGGRATPIPLQIFDLLPGPDGTTIYRADPETRHALIIEESDPIGAHRLGLICSSCTPEPAREVLGRWLSTIRDDLAGDAPDPIAKMPDGVGYAIGTFEKRQ